MDVILYTDASPQTLETTILGTPVRIRASPTHYRWDLGDGNTISTSTPGRPYPATDIVSRYKHEGWYDVTLTTTFRGEFSVADGPWQPIDGTMDVTSPPVALFARSYESRLVNPDSDPTEDENPTLPPRRPDTQGPRDEKARHRNS